jgi:hypothetical protein
LRKIDFQKKVEKKDVSDLWAEVFELASRELVGPYSTYAHDFAKILKEAYGMDAEELFPEGFASVIDQFEHEAESMLEQKVQDRKKWIEGKIQVLKDIFEPAPEVARLMRELGNEGTIHVPLADKVMPHVEGPKDGFWGTMVRSVAQTTFNHLPIPEKVRTWTQQPFQIMLNLALAKLDSSYKPGDYCFKLTFKNFDLGRSMLIVDRRSSVNRYAPPVWADMTADAVIEGMRVVQAPSAVRRWYSYYHGTHGLELEKVDAEKVKVSIPLLYELLRSEDLGASAKDIGLIYSNKSKQLDGSVSSALLDDPFIRNNTVRVACMLTQWTRTSRVENKIPLDFLPKGDDCAVTR